MRRTTIGGSALIEGLMMIGPNNASMAVRKPDGEIFVEKRNLPIKSKYANVPVIRGIVNFVRQMVLVTGTMMRSAEFIELEDADTEPTKFDRFLERVFGDRLKEAIVYISLIISLCFTVGLFMLLPNFIASLFRFDKSFTGVLLYNLIEGVLRISIFMGYLALVSKMNDVKRLWQYHGAEHKTINCYEHEEDLTVENVMKHSTKNKRCGTSFLFLVIVVSIVIFAFTGWYSIIVNLLIRLALVPVIAGVAYEILKYAGRSDSKLSDIISAPGFFFQMFTTSEPDEKQVEVAIAAFNDVRPDDGTDKW